MHGEPPFAVARDIVWRSRPSGDVGFVFGCRVLLDDPDVAAVLQTTGSPIVRRIGQRGGPQGRSLLPGTWDGARHLGTWDRPPCVRLHPVGRHYSVIRTWIVEEARFAGWYINLEQPWTRTPIGFDSRDDILDVTVSDDLTEWRLKDVDELQFAIEVGLFTPEHAEAIHAAAASAITDIVSRRWPFSEAAWRRVSPTGLLGPTTLPDGWDTV